MHEVSLGLCNVYFLVDVNGYIGKPSCCNIKNPIQCLKNLMSIICSKEFIAITSVDNIDDLIFVTPEGT